MIKKSFLFYFLCCLLSSCGFQLRGSGVVPPALHSLHIQTHRPYSTLTRKLIATFNSANMNTTFGHTCPQHLACLRIIHESLGKHTISANTSVEARDYSLTLRVLYSLSDGNRRLLIAPTTIASSRQATVNRNKTLDATDQVRVFKNEMENEITSRLFNRLGSNQVRHRLQKK